MAASAEAETTVTVGVTALPAALGHPFMGSSMPTTLPWAAIYDTLTWLDDAGKADQALAVDWQAIDSRTWEFKLRPDVKFHNGEPLNADAVVAAVKFIASSAGLRTSLGNTLGMIKRAEKRDDLTVILKTDAPTPLLPLLTRQLRIPAPLAFAKLGAEDFAKAPVGTGPFMVNGWGPAEISAKAFPEAWRKAKVDNLVIRNVPDSATRVAALISGELDIAMWLLPEDQPAIAAVGGQLISRREPSLNMMTFVTAKASPLKDPRVRVALNLAVDRKKIIDAFLAGKTEPATQYALPSSFGFDTALEAFPYDPDRARIMLSDAGYYRGFSMVVSIVPGQGAQSIYQQIAADLALIGVKVELRPVPLSQFVSYMREHDWPGPACANSQSMIDPIETMRATACGASQSFHCSKEISAMVERARGEFDIQQRLGLIRDIHKAQRLDPPALFFWQGVALDGVGAKVKGYRVVQDMIRFEEIQK
ncbi:MAG: ABC transporter substrate-binding protein [Alphaproteobacteria bacterium]|nr:ABC transporter substrate-binding protein [Alphaproteobacteria bacterium]